MDIPKKAGYHGSMRPNGTSQQLEKRRLQAIAMLESGKSYQTVAHRLSASLSSVVRWVQSYRQEGRARLKAKPCFLIRLLRLVTHKNFCDLASMPLTYRGGEMLLYPLFMRSSINCNVYLMENEEMPLLPNYKDIVELI